MFGVGLHFSIKDLVAVRRIAIPGALVQIVVAALLGAGLVHLWGWTAGAGLVFGLALSVASTVVLLRALEQRNTLDSIHGRIAVGRSEERRVGEEGVGPCRSRWSPYH